MNDDNATLPLEKPAGGIRRLGFIRNWRRLLIELAIVVVGVGLALAAQQGAEWWNWRSEVKHAREVIATEMAQNVAMAIFKMRSLDCAERRLDELTDILDAASVSGHLPPLGDIGVSPRGLMSTGAWDTIVASQIATHFPRQQLADLSGSYARVARVLERPDFDDWTELSTMTGPGRRLDPNAEQDLRKALSRTRANGRIVASIAGLVVEGVKAQNLPFSAKDLAIIADARNRPLNDGRVFLLCQPIGAAPIRYGQAPMNAWRAATSQRIKQLPDFGVQ